MTYIPNDAATVRHLAFKKGIERPLTQSGWLTADMLRAGSCELVWESTLSFRPSPRREDCFVLLEASDEGDYVVTVGRPGEQITARTDRLNRARQMFHAFAHSFVTGDPQEEADAFALFEQHQTQEVHA